MRRAGVVAARAALHAAPAGSLTFRQANPVLAAATAPRAMSTMVNRHAPARRAAAVGGFSSGDITRKALFHASARSEVTGPLLVGLGVGAAALVVRYGLEAYHRMASTPVSRTATVRKNYKGGFDDPMTRREASLILGCRQSSPADVVRSRHKKLLIKNHPDRGGSTLISIKVNEAKAVLLGEKSASS